MLRSVLSLILFVSFGLAEKRLVCYWFRYSPAAKIDVNICTHIHYSFVTLDSSTLLVRFKNNAEITGDVKNVFNLKSQNANLKIVAALGGGGDGADGKYSRMVANLTSRDKFVKNAVKFLNQHKFDGLDFDWEYPACPHTVCDEKHKPEKAYFASVLKELRTAFDKNSRKLSLSVAVNAGKWLTDNAYDYPTMASALDYINVMTYDNAGSWMQVTGHHAGFDWAKKGVQFWASTGVPKSKLLLGVPFYGIIFTLNDPAKHEIEASATSTNGALTYSQICTNVKKQGWTKERSIDGPIAYKENQWVSYDDPNSAAAKAKWVKDNGYGGILVWEIGHDDQNGTCCTIPKPMIKALGYGLFGKGAEPTTYGCE